MDCVIAQDEMYMQCALAEASRASSIGEVPIGTVLVQDHKIVAKAHNCCETWKDPSAHAEIIAIRMAAARMGTWRLTKVSLYSTLEPCAMCAGAIVHARIARLVFGAGDPKAGACGSVFNIPEEPRLNHHVTVRGGVCALESRTMLRAFFLSRRSRRKRMLAGLLLGSR